MWPSLSAGNSATVLAAAGLVPQAFGGSHSNVHVGLGQSIGAVHFQSHNGFSQICSHVLVSLGHTVLHVAFPHCIAHPGHELPAQGDGGQRTLHCGSLHSILQPAVDKPLQRVWHFGDWQDGEQTWSHWLVPQRQVHFGMHFPVVPPGWVATGGGATISAATAATGGGDTVSVALSGDMSLTLSVALIIGSALSTAPLKGCVFGVPAVERCQNGFTTGS